MEELKKMVISCKEIKVKRVNSLSAGSHRGGFKVAWLPSNSEAAPYSVTSALLAKRCGNARLGKNPQTTEASNSEPRHRRGRLYRETSEQSHVKELSSLLIHKSSHKSPVSMRLSIEVSDNVKKECHKTAYSWLVNPLQWRHKLKKSYWCLQSLGLLCDLASHVVHSF